MTASEFARLIHARNTARDKWVARCPAHEDRHPSLSIAVGRDGRVLIHCFAGCTHREIVKALGLQEVDLFNGSRFQGPHNAVVVKAVREQKMAATAQRRTRGALSDEYRRLSKVVDALGAKLARTPERVSSGDAMAQLFHLAVERLRTVEAEINKGCKC